MNRTAARAGQESGRSDGSRTLTIHDVPTPEAGGSGGAGPSRGGDSPSDGVLRLRGRGDQSDNRRVVWSEGTVDNEGLGRKKSKSEYRVKPIRPLPVATGLTPLSSPQSTFPTSLLHLPQAQGIRRIIRRVLFWLRF